jgi:AraC-like DNA-binding protein
MKWGEDLNFKTFYINNRRIKYQELLTEDPVFEKFYLIENPHQDDIVAIPDGCVDFQFVWENGTCRGYVCGSFLQGKRSLTGTYPRCFGMKMQPGLQFSFLPADTAKLVGSRVPLSEFVETASFERQLEQLSCFAEMIEAARCFFGTKEITPTHILASSTAKIIFDTPGTIRVAEMVGSLGYSQRYINNVFKHCFGLSVKKYSDIIRIQAAIRYLESADVMDVISDLGYYDQAHFIRDFKQYTSLTPKSFIEQVRGTKEGIIV